MDLQYDIYYLCYEKYSKHLLVYVRGTTVMICRRRLSSQEYIDYITCWACWIYDFEIKNVFKMYTFIQMPMVNVLKWIYTCKIHSNLFVWKIFIWKNYLPFCSSSVFPFSVCLQITFNFVLFPSNMWSSVLFLYGYMSKKGDMKIYILCT